MRRVVPAKLLTKQHLSLEKYLKSSERMNPVDTLRATLLVDIDDHTNPEQLTISCFHKNGRGFKAAFLDDVSTLEKRKDYIATFSSNKLSEAKLHADIPLFIGGRGQGLRMLMRKFSFHQSSYSRFWSGIVMPDLVSKLKLQMAKKEWQNDTNTLSKGKITPSQTLI
jgi:hypothetical protein